MKRLTYSLGLMILMLACHSDIFPADSLYQRWQFSQSRRGNGPWAQNYKPTVDDTEYRRDGVLVYRVNGQIKTVCCNPNHFNRQKNELTFTDDNPCPNSLALCAAYPKNATITQLTDNLLELTRGDVVMQYTPVN